MRTVRALPNREGVPSFDETDGVGLPTRRIAALGAAAAPLEALLGVAERARTIASIVGEDAELLEAAAVLHDIGYSPDLAKTGFHPLDGARYLRDVADADQRVVHLVAHHSCAWMEAEARGLREELEGEFPVRARTSMTLSATAT